MSESRWIAVSGGKLPEPGQPYWGLYGNGTVCCIAMGLPHPQHTEATHWMPSEGSHQIPTPPVIKSPAELAWERRVETVNGVAECRSCYIAGFEDGLSEGRKG